MRHRSRRRLVLALPLTFLFVGGALFSQPKGQGLRDSLIAPKAACREVVLARKPGWTFSGAWTSDNPPQLLIVDVLYETILRYSAKGESIGSIGEPLKSSLRDLLPRVAKSRGSDLIVEISDGFMVLDKNLRPSQTKRVLTAKAKGDWSIGALWQWEPVGQEIVAFTDVVATGSNREELSNWKTAFVRFPLESPGDVTVLRLGERIGDDKIFFRAGNPYIASIGDTAYILSVSGGLSLYESEKGSDELKDVSYLLPASLESPSLPPFNPRKDYYVQLMAALENEAMPVGLYSWGDTLYILSRTPTGRGTTRWDLTSIDPHRRKATGRVELPIRANHVTVVPGSEMWAFLEKGPVKTYGAQDISRVLFISSRLLQSPLKPEGPLCTR